eukprot:TCONS_00028548-protein
MNNLEEPDEAIEGTYGGPYMVEQIIAIYVGKDRKKYYRVKWVDSWEPEDNLSEACSALIDNFWSSSARDQTGKEVNRTELKAGQKIIKKEIIESRLNNENNPDSPTESYIGNNKVVPTLKSDISAHKDEINVQIPSTSGEKIKKLKQELMSPTATTFPDKSQSVPPDLGKIQHELLSKSKIEAPSKQADKKVNNNESQQIVKIQTTSTSTQATKDVHQKPQNKSPKRRSIDCQTQTDPVLDDIIEFDDPPRVLSPVQHHSISIGTDPPTATQRSTNHTEPFSNRQPYSDSDSEKIVNFQDGRMGNQEGYSSQNLNDELPYLNDELEQTIYQSQPNPPTQRSINDPNFPNQQNLNKQSYQSINEPSHPGPPSIDASDEQSMDESDIVDLASEEDELEITFSLSTPPSKRQCLDKSKQKQLPASTSRLEKRTREKVTMRRRRNSDSERNTSTANTGNNMPLLHPRSLLSMYPNGQQPTGNQAQNTINNASNSPQQIPNQENLQAQTTLRRTLIPSNTGVNNNIQSSNTLPGANTNPVAKLTDRTCNLCKHTFPNLTLARQHMKKMHATPSSTATNQINLQTRPTNNVNNNPTQSPQQRSSTTVPTKELSCTVCFGLFRNNRDLKSHMLLHTEKNMHQCEVCLKAFRHKSTLAQHMLIHTQELPFECKTCGQKFRQRGHLITHMGKHTQNSEGSLHCPYCSLISKDINEFRNHVRSHEQELPFKCSQCSERFQKRHDLSLHLDAHNEGRPFTCPICKKSFKTKPYLFGHMQMHKSNDVIQRPQQTNRPMQQSHPQFQQSGHQAQHPNHQAQHPNHQIQQPTQRINQQLNRNTTSPMLSTHQAQQRSRQHPQQQQQSPIINNNNSQQNKLLNPSQRLQQQRKNSLSNPTPPQQTQPKPPTTVSVKTQSES